MSKHSSVLKVLCVSFLILVVGLIGPVSTSIEASDEAPEEVRIAVVSFLSGSAAAPFGIPGRNAIEILKEKLNAGNVPAPYNEKGIGNVPISVKFFDEAGGASAQVELYRKIAGNFDVVMGYISSADGKALAPVVEEEKQLTVFADLGTNAIFEEVVPDPKFLFRTSDHQALDAIGAARYALQVKPDLKTVSGINQDYAWGHDNWDTFLAAIKKLNPGVKLAGNPQFPALYSGGYSSEISALLRADPDVIYTSFWGGDTEAFMMQARGRGLFDQSLVIFSCGDSPLPRLGGTVPAGIGIGARGPHGCLSPDNELNKYFIDVYEDRYGIRPIYPSYHYAQAILGVKAAYEKAIATNDGDWPSVNQVIKALEYLRFETPSGTINMKLGKGHQAVEPTAYGITGSEVVDGERELTQIQKFLVEDVNPSPGMSVSEWIEKELVLK